MQINTETGQQRPETLDDALACAEIQGWFTPLYPDTGEFIDAPDQDRERMLDELECAQ